MTFSEKIDKVLTLNRINLRTIQDLEQIAELGSGTIRKNYNDNREMSQRSTWKLIEKIGINREWWDTGEGEVFKEKGTSELNKEEKAKFAERQLFDKERELYERLIKQLEDRVAYLESLPRKEG